VLVVQGAAAAARSRQRWGGGANPAQHHPVQRPSTTLHACQGPPAGCQPIGSCPSPARPGPPLTAPARPASGLPSGRGRPPRPPLRQLGPASKSALPLPADAAPAWRSLPYSLAVRPVTRPQATPAAAAAAAVPKDTPQERLKRIRAAQLNKQLNKDHTAVMQKKLQVGETLARWRGGCLRRPGGRLPGRCPLAGGALEGGRLPAAPARAPGGLLPPGPAGPAAYSCLAPRLACAFTW
jgi:hypothetical protein